MTLDEQLVEAVKNGNRPLMIQLLEQGASLDAKDNHGQSCKSLLEDYLSKDTSKDRNYEEYYYLECLFILAKLRSMESKLKKEKTLKPDSKTAEEINQLQSKMRETADILDVKRKALFKLKYLELIGQSSSPFHDDRLAHRLKHDLLFKFLKILIKFDREKIALKLYDILFNTPKHFSFEDVKLRDIIHSRFWKMSEEEIEERFASLFNEPEVILRVDEKERGKYICSIRVPPLTRHYQFEITICDHFKVAGVEGLAEHLDALIKLVTDHLKAEVDRKRKAIEEEFSGIDLKRFVESRESSIRELSGKQRGIMDAIKKQYREKFEKMGGQNGVLEDFKLYLEKRYLETQPEYMGMRLPLEYDRDLDTKEIREQYYVHPFHTAWRYLLVPNPWIDAIAPYSIHNAQDIAIHANIPQDLKIELAYLWLAASDPTITPIRDMTTEDMMEQFVQEIANLNRGHNWDELDAMKEDAEKKKMMENMIKKWGKVVDDLKPDNPSCSLGTKQRFLQAIHSHPITETVDAKPLNPTIMRQIVGDYIATRFNEYLLTRKSTEIQAMLDAFIKQVSLEELSEVDLVLLKDFNLSTQDIKKLIVELQKQYGERIIWLEMRTDAERYFSYEAYVRSLEKKNLWELSFSERMFSIAQRRLAPFQMELEKEKDKDPSLSCGPLLCLYWKETRISQKLNAFWNNLRKRDGIPYQKLGP